MPDEAVQPIVVEVSVAAPVEDVWASLRDPGVIRLWHGWDYDGLDDEVDQIYGASASADDEGRTLQLDGGDRFELEDQSGLTVVRLTRTRPDAEADGADGFDEVTEGWISFLQQLRFMHELHPSDPRRTLFFSGHGEPELVERLLSSTPRLLGQRWFTAEHQSGRMLPDLGPGLLIVAARDAADGDGSEVMVIVTTYGIADDMFHRHLLEWTEWWEGAFAELAAERP